MKIDIHADDYALTVNASKDILECAMEGKLDSISIVPNMNCFKECMEMFYAAIPDMPFLPRLNIHLNLVEGNVFPKSYTWGKLFLASYDPVRRMQVYRNIKKAINRQFRDCDNAIKKCIKIANENNIPVSQRGVRIDSHQHTHHIPIVWKALLYVLKYRNMETEYIRCSREPLSIFFSPKVELFFYRPVNILKNLVLNAYSSKIDKYVREQGQNNMYLLGIVMSGRMDEYRVKNVLSALKRQAEKDGKDIEILFHPGRALTNEDRSGLNLKAQKSFYMSSDRSVEKKALKSMR